MTAANKFVRQPRFRLPGISIGPASLLLAAILILLIGSWLAFTQAPRANPYAPVTLSDQFFYPIEINPFQRLPKISSNLNSIYVLPESGRVWAVGGQGLIIHTRDGGLTWRRQDYPGNRASDPSNSSDQLNQKRSLLDFLLSDAYAAESGYGNEKPATVIDKKVAPDKSLPTASSSRPAAQENRLNTPERRDIPNQLSEQVIPIEKKRAGSPSEKDNKQEEVVRASEKQPDLRAVIFLDDRHGWIVGDRGTILATEDGGNSWRTQTSGTREALHAVGFGDSLQGWAVGSRGVIVHTEDGGNTWRLQRGGTTEKLSAISVVDKSLVWAVGAKGTIVHSGDGGRNWLAQSSGSSAQLNSVSFVDSRHGWAVGAYGTIIATDDGGNHWQSQKSGTRAQLTSVTFVDARRGWAGGFHGAIVRTLDGGNTWFVQSDLTEGPLYSISFADVRKGWAVGAEGQIIFSDDGGKTWRSRSKQTTNTLTSVSFVDGWKGWSVGYDGAILNSRDGGKSWQIQRSGTQDVLNSVTFVDQLWGWAVGQNGTIVHSRDGGDTWSAQNSGTTNALAAVTFVDRQRGWAVGLGGTVIASDDGGRTWRKQNSGTTNTLVSLKFIDTRRGWAVGWDGTIIHTEDGGLNWNRQDSGTRQALYSVMFVDPLQGWAAGWNGTMLHTENGGDSWLAQRSGTEEPFNSVMFIDGRQGWAAGWHGTIVHSEDGGETWSGQSSGTGEALNSVFFSDARQGWGVGVRGTLLYTVDGGSTWGSPAYKRYPAAWYYLLCVSVVLLTWLALRNRQEQAVKQETIADLLASDRPLHTGDPDPLGFSDIARGLSRFVRNPRTEPPLTIAVTGEWGTGKSSLMNLLYEDLQDRGFSTVWFNAWHHQKSEQLLATLFANIRRQAIPGWLKFSGPRPVGLLFRLRLLLRRSRRHWLIFLLMVLLLSATVAYVAAESGHFMRLMSWLDTYLTELSNQLKIVFALGATGATLLPLFVFLKSLQGFALNPLKLMTVHGGEGQKAVSVDPGARYQFAREFQDVTASLDLSRMIIFIDDLDRCAKENVLEVLEAINFLVSSGHCYIILGMAKEWVQICVGLGFKELATESFSNSRAEAEIDPVEHRRRFARQYLEKMINIEVPVPVLDENKALKLTVPEKESLALSEFDKLYVRLGRYLRRNWPMLAFLTMISIGTYWGLLHDLPMPEKVSEQQLRLEDLAAWPAEDLEVTTEQGLRLSLSAAKADFESKASALSPHALEWVLRADPQSLQQGLAVQTFADGKGKLLLRKFRPAQAKTKSEIPVSPPEDIMAPREHESETGGFSPGAVNQAAWPENIPYVLAIAVLLAGLALLFRKPDRIVEDSKPFREALKIWQEWLLLRKQTPRTIKRFLNHLRYMAMRYRIDEEPRSLWQRWKHDAKQDNGGQTVFSEPALVALHMLYFIEPSWVADAEKFERVRQRDFDGLIDALGDAEHTDSTARRELSKKLAETVKQHQAAFRDESLASDEQRRLFLNAMSGGELG
ncbi:YCF48-related protein [Methylomarinum vadi]|uniref:YCF48-related protein n=1 Tax=Methylomarinum vadi TaxID=438855 RepID=UPI00068B5411|nr:YCF48-related protein [Methylomarinum vadi]